MRITRSDSQKLVVLDFPWLIPLLGFPIATVLLCLAAAAVYRNARDGGPLFTGSESGDLWGLLFGGLLCLAVSVAFTQRSEFVFDFVERKLTWRRRGFFVNKGGVLALDAVRGAFVKESDFSDGDTYTVALQTTAGVILISEYYTSGQSRFLRLRDAINAALKVSTSDALQTEDEILELALAGRKIDAIALARRRYGYDLAQAKAFVESLSG